MKLVKSVVSRLDVSFYGTHVGYVAFDKDWIGVQQLQTLIQLDSIMPTAYRGPQQNLSTTIKVALDGIFMSAGNRPEVADVMVVVLGGPSLNSTLIKDVAQAAKSAGIKIVTVGVGPNVDVDELKDIATNATEAERLHVVASENVTALLPTLLEYIRDLVVDIPDLGK